MVLSRSAEFFDIWPGVGIASSITSTNVGNIIKKLLSLAFSDSFLEFIYQNLLAASHFFYYSMRGYHHSLNFLVHPSTMRHPP